MKVTITAGNLGQGLQVVSRAVSSRTTLPILNNVLLQTADSGLQLTATNLEIGIRQVIPAEIQEEGGITVPARLLTDFVTAHPDEPLARTLRWMHRIDSLPYHCDGVFIPVRVANWGYSVKGCPSRFCIHCTWPARRARRSEPGTTPRAGAGAPPPTGLRQAFRAATRPVYSAIPAAAPLLSGIWFIVSHLPQSRVPRRRGLVYNSQPSPSLSNFGRS